MAEAFPVSGNIEPASFPHLLVDLHRHGATGSLKVTGPVHPEGSLLPGGPHPLRLLERPARPARRDPHRERPHHARAARRGERQGRARATRSPRCWPRAASSTSASSATRRASRSSGSWPTCCPGTRARSSSRTASCRRAPSTSSSRPSGCCSRRCSGSPTAASPCATSTSRRVLEPAPAGEAALSEVRAEVWPLLERLDGHAHAQGRHRPHPPRRVRGRQDRLRDAVPRRRAPQGAGAARSSTSREEAQSGFGAEPAPMYTVPVEAMPLAGPEPTGFAFSEPEPAVAGAASPSSSRSPRAAADTVVLPVRLSRSRSRSRPEPSRRREPSRDAAPSRPRSPTRPSFTMDAPRPRKPTDTVPGDRPVYVPPAPEPAAALAATVHADAPLRRRPSPEIGTPGPGPAVAPDPGGPRRARRAAQPLGLRTARREPGGAAAPREVGAPVPPADHPPAQGAARARGRVVALARAVFIAVALGGVVLATRRRVVLLPARPRPRPPRRRRDGPATHRRRPTAGCRPPGPGRADRSRPTAAPTAAPAGRDADARARRDADARRRAAARHADVRRPRHARRRRPRPRRPATRAPSWRRARSPRPPARSPPRSRPGARGRFSLQVLVACAPENVQKAVSAVPAQELFILPVNVKGRACYRLCWGVYDGRPAAEAALASLPVVLPAGRRHAARSRLSPSCSPDRAAPAPPARRPRGARGRGGRAARLRRPHERPRDRGRPGLVRGRGAALPAGRDGLRRRRARSSRGVDARRRRAPLEDPDVAPQPRAPRRRGRRRGPALRPPRSLPRARAPCPRSRRSPRPSSPSATWRGRARAPTQRARRSSRATRARSSCSATRWSRAATSLGAREQYRLSLEVADAAARAAEARRARHLRRLRLERALPDPLRRRLRRAARPRRPARARLGLGGVREAPRLRARRCRSRSCCRRPPASATRRARRTGRRPGTTGRSACPVVGLDRPDARPRAGPAPRARALLRGLARRGDLPHLAPRGPRAVARGRRPASARTPALAPPRATSPLPRLESLERPFVGLLGGGRRRRPTRRASRPWPTCSGSGGEAGVRRLIEALGRRAIPPPRRCPPPSRSATASCSATGRPTCVARRRDRRRRPSGVRAFAERACKPDSVPAAARAAGGDHSSSPAVARGVQQPTRGPRPGQPQTPPYSVLLRVGFSLPAVSPRRRCALTAPFHPCHPRSLPREFGGVFSVALSLRSPSLAVNQHAALWSPDFPPRLGDAGRGDRPARSANTSRVAPRTAR